MAVKLTPAQILLGKHMKELGIKSVEIIPEYRFWDERRWRLDIAVPHLRLGCEVSGGNWTGGHSRGKAQEKEYDKLNYAQMRGWRIMQWTNRQVLSGEAKEFLKIWLGKERK
jgi:hypothetical protein